MADASKITVNGETYDVKDPTARNAASAAQTTANGKLSDAPSDGKEYLRKNGAWTEPSGGGGSGVPDGGTIGQVLAKNSDTDGDAGWYNLRHLPSDKWYLPDGIVESDVIAAYQFVNRLDEAEALINVNDGTKYPLSKAVGTEAWNAEKGFFIPGTRKAGLNNELLKAQYTNYLCAAFGFSGVMPSTGTYNYTIGLKPHYSRELSLRGYTNSGDKIYPIIANFSGTKVYNANTYFEHGVISGNYTDTPKMYMDGAQLSLSSNSINTEGKNVFFGHIDSNGSYASGYVTAIVVLRCELNLGQHLQLSDNIRALGGIDS